MNPRNQEIAAKTASGKPVYLTNLISLEGLQKSDISNYDLSEYATCGELILREVKGKHYGVQYYQGKHENEYTIMEIKDGIPDGKAQLFKYGILKLMWTMKQGKRYGVLTIYNDGKVDKEVLWSNFEKNATEERVVQNCDYNQKVLTIKDIKTGKIVYKGRCNDHLERHGFGIAYHNETGYPQYTGYFVNDELFHISQQVLAYTPIQSTPSDSANSVEDTSSESKIPMDNNQLSFLNIKHTGKGRMVEYGGDSTESNTELIEVLPIYIGEFVYCEELRTLLRHGEGNEINKYSGICEHVSSWWNGTRQKIVENLYNGWNCKCDAETSLRIELDSQKRESQQEENTNTIPMEKSKFSFRTKQKGDSDSTSTTPSAFSFGGKPSDSTSTTPSAFSFGGKPSGFTSTTTSAFSFGGKPSDSTSTTPSAFSFGRKQSTWDGRNFQEYQKAFGFTSMNENSPQDKK